MDRYIAYCGLNCKTCEAYLATVNDDQALREKVATDRIALVTDSMRGAGMPDGTVSMLGHWKNGLETVIEDGVAKLPDRSAFAGSVATFDRLVRNMLRMAEAPMHEVITMASRTPARIMGFNDRGELAAGLRADIVLFDDDVNVSAVMKEGRLIWMDEKKV